MTPKARRLHLIQAHAFPKEYFFAVTNKGVGGLLKKWGEGASLIRGSWKAREEQNECDSDEDILDEDAESLESTREMLSQETDDARALNSGESHTTQLNVDALASSMDSLTLIPNTIRFGRGAKNFRSPRGYQRGGGSRGARYDSSICRRQMSSYFSILCQELYTSIPRWGPTDRIYSILSGNIYSN